MGLAKPYSLDILCYPIYYSNDHDVKTYFGANKAILWAQ